MDPVQNWRPGFAADASLMAMAETSADSRAASQPPSAEQLMRGLGNMNPGAGPDLPVGSVPSVLLPDFVFVTALLGVTFQDAQ